MDRQTVAKWTLAVLSSEAKAVMREKTTLSSGLASKQASLAMISRTFQWSRPSRSLISVLILLDVIEDLVKARMLIQVRNGF